MATATKASEHSRGHVARLPGDIHMWVFVLGDLCIFAAYFAIFMVYRIHERSLFLESQQHLGLNTAAANTLVLLASSRFVALAVQAARASNHVRAQRLIAYAGSAGVLFVAIKVYEWVSEASHGFTLPRNDFFMFYYMLTGVHLFHVLLGLVVLGVVWVNLRNPRRRRPSVVEQGATYWHMVDLLWVVIFALVYVMR